MATNLDHLTIRNIDEGHLFACAHCGVAEIVRLPMALDDWLAQSRRFQSVHRHCQPQSSGQKAVAKKPTPRLEF